MSNPTVSFKTVQDFHLWKKIEGKRFPLSFDLELTARCNNECRHCYINLPATDKLAKDQELNLVEIDRISDEAVSMGAFSCLITGGEPLLRKDFTDIYLSLKRKGLLVCIFTNATLITPEYIKLFKKYPPRDIEVSVYGVTKETYEGVTRKPGSFAAFMRGLNLLLENGIKVRLKAMALRSNIHELDKISAFCRERTKDFFRFDPLLHMRFDRNEMRNAEIRTERLTPEEITAIERADSKRFESLKKGCDKLIFSNDSHRSCDHIFHCGAGKWSFNISYNGLLRPCSSLWHPDFLYDIRNGSVKEAWEQFIPTALDYRSNRPEFHKKCHVCPIINLCLWCPAHAYLETGELDMPVDTFCRIAHARASMLNPETRRSGVD